MLTDDGVTSTSFADNDVPRGWMERDSCGGRHCKNAAAFPLPPLQEPRQIPKA